MKDADPISLDKLLLLAASCKDLSEEAKEVGSACLKLRYETLWQREWERDESIRGMVACDCIFWNIANRKIESGFSPPLNF